MQQDTDLSFMAKPSTVDDVEMAKKAREIISAPATPKYTTSLNDFKEIDKEEYEAPPSALQDDLAWFFPAMAYHMVGVNKSLFEIYKHASLRTFKVRTYCVDKSLITMPGADIHGLKWFGTVQGIPREFGTDFANFISEFEFRGPPGGVSWALDVRSTRMRDPFSKDLKGVDVSLLLPVDLFNQKRIAVVREPGLHLDPPVVAIVDNKIVNPRFAALAQ